MLSENYFFEMKTTPSTGVPEKSKVPSLISANMSEKERCILSQTKIGMEGVEPPSQFPADYFENKVELEF